MFVYTDEEREESTWALPNVEVFYLSEGDAADFWGQNDLVNADNMPEAGWYFWFCFPGCLPDSDPFGPFATEDAAIEAARDMD